jgi:hypothetical protein
MKKRLCLRLFAVLISTLMVKAQDVSVAQARADGSVRFLIVVTTKSGQPVVDLREEDFTVFDDDVIRPIRSFRTIDGPEKQDRHLFTIVTLANPSEDSSAKGTGVTYEIIFDGAKSPGRRQFHEVGIEVDRPNLEIITSPGYLTSASHRSRSE